MSVVTVDWSWQFDSWEQLTFLQLLGNCLFEKSTFLTIARYFTDMKYTCNLTTNHSNVLTSFNSMVNSDSQPVKQWKVSELEGTAHWPYTIHSHWSAIIQSIRTYFSYLSIYLPIMSNPCWGPRQLRTQWIYYTWEISILSSKGTQLYTANSAVSTELCSHARYELLCNAFTVICYDLFSFS